MAADETALGTLHDQVAKVLTKELQGRVLPAYKDEDDVEHPEAFLGPSAAMITASIQFLKNNNITCVPSKDNELGALEEAMKRQRAKRNPANPMDMRVAEEGVRFLDGLPN